MCARRIMISAIRRRSIITISKSKASSTAAGANGVDADPAQIVGDFLTNAQYGVGFPSSSIDATTLYGSGGDASLQTYCKAAGLALSPALTNQETASSILGRWLQLCNTAAVWSGGLFRLIPYGDSAVTGGGVTFTPDVTPHLRSNRRRLQGGRQRRSAAGIALRSVSGVQCLAPGNRGARQRLQSDDGGIARSERDRALRHADRFDGDRARNLRSERRADFRPAHVAACGLYPQHLQIPSVMGVLPARPDGFGNGHRFDPGPGECADPHHRNRGGRERLPPGDGRGVSAGCGNSDALCDATGLEQSDQPQPCARFRQYADHLRAAGRARRHNCAGVDRGIGRLRRRGRSELGWGFRVAVARWHLLHANRHDCLAGAAGRAHRGARGVRRNQPRHHAHIGGKSRREQRRAVERHCTRRASSPIRCPSSMPSFCPTRRRR